MNYDELLARFVDHWPWLAGLGPAAAGAVGTMIRAFVRRPKTTSEGSPARFQHRALLSPPMERPAYSDRMAYVLAEMSALAYYRFEGEEGLVNDMSEIAAVSRLASREKAKEFLAGFASRLLSGRELGLECFRKILAASGFKLLDVIDVAETQGFVCRRDAEGETPYVVLAFRGTEKKVSDWLTDANCVPVVKDRTKVHKGFLKALTGNRDASDRTVEEIVESILDSEDAQDADRRPLPLFITGHSLGGALALLTTVLVKPDIDGACYTFGAPRVANYELFRMVKTPVYRVVNSSDAVPRVPPGATMQLVRGAIRGLAWAVGWWPGVSGLLNRVEARVDKLNGYRHYGDLRYLSDVSAGRFDTVALLTNPPAIDRIVWMWRGIVKDVWRPVKAHGVEIYCRKLAQVAESRRRRNAEPTRPGAAEPAGAGSTV